MDLNDKKTGWKRWRAVTAVICAMVLVALAASYGLRSSMYLKARLTPKLNELGSVLGGEFSFKEIRAIGVTGISLGHVEFMPKTPGAHPIVFEAVTVYPDMMGMFVGDLNASRVEIDQMSVTWGLDETMADRRWLEEIRSSLTGTSVAVERDLKIDGSTHAIPDVVCRNCQITAKHKNRHYDISIPHEQLTVISRETGQIQFAGETVDLCTWGENQEKTCFKAKMTGLKVKDSIHIPNLEIRDLHRADISINALVLNEIEFGQNEQRSMIFVQTGQIDAHIEQDTQFSAFSGDYWMEFSSVEILLDKLNHRIGAGVSLRSRDASTARIFGGYDIEAQKLALTFDTSEFDFARFLQKADFSQYIQITSLPLTGHIETIVELGQSRAWMDISAGIHHGTVVSSALARDPLSEIDAKLDAKLWFDGQNRTFGFEDAHGMLGKIPFEFRLRREKDATGHYQFDVSIDSKGESGDFIDSLPKGFAPMLSGYKLEGPYSAHVGVSYDDSNLDALILDADFDLSKVQTLAYDPRSDFEMLKSDAFMVRINAATVPLQIGPRDEKWVGFYDLPRNTAYAFVASEDGKFFTHPGFDIRAIRASLIADLKAEKFVRGGSTISQQVVKNIFLNHDKTASRKFQEAFLTWQMEKTLSKLKIFELYLNLAHFAKDTYGIRAAAKYYFQKNVTQLTLRESLFLASILPNPVIFGRQYIEGKLSSSRLTKMINVGNALRSTNRISEKDWNEAAILLREGKISEQPKPELK